MISELKSFFENNDLAIKAAESIKDGREIAIVITKSGEELGYTFAKVQKKNSLTLGLPQKPDLTFIIPERAAKELVEKNFESIGQVGIYIFERMLSADPNQKIRAKLKTGFLGLMTGGYFGVLTAGGADVAKFLASRGLSMGKIKEIIGKLKGD